MLELRNLLYRITLLDKMLFTKHLAVMLKSGIPISEAIDSLKDQTNNPSFRIVLDEVYKDISNGQSLEKALSKHKRVFSSLYLSLISAGEKSGNLDSNLEYLSGQLKKNYELNKKISGATLYPKIVLAATLIIGTSLSIFVLPQLVPLFTALDVKLPITTKILLFFANTMKNYGLFVGGGLVALIILVSYLLRTSVVKPFYHQFLLSVPIFGNLTKSFELTNICRNLGIMLKSGLTITSALETQYDSTENLVFKGYLKKLLEAVEKGKKLSLEMDSAKLKYMPSIASKMIKVGEETGKLDEVLLYLGDFFEEEADDMAQNLSSILEPILLLVIGAVVAFVALSIITPIYELSSGIKR